MTATFPAPAPIGRCEHCDARVYRAEDGGGTIRLGFVTTADDSFTVLCIPCATETKPAPVRIWSHKRMAWYAPLMAGYTSADDEAGRFDPGLAANHVDEVNAGYGRAVLEIRP